MNQRNVTTKHSNSLVKELKRLLSITLAFVMCLSVVPGITTPVFADSPSPIIQSIEAQPASPSVNAGYTPTHLVNGDFEQHPEIYPNDVDRIYELNEGLSAGAYYGANGTFADIPTLVSYINANASDDESSVVKPIIENWKTSATSRMSQNSGVRNTLFEWVNRGWKKSNGTSVVSGNYGLSLEECENGNFIEMNADGEAVFYQDLATTPNDIILWRLLHGVRRSGGANEQGIEVEIGKPMSNPTGTDSGLLPNSAKYTSTTFSGIGAYGKLSELENLSMLKTAIHPWGEAKAIYTVPAGQDITRFAFISIAGGSQGNFLDGVYFETLLGNVKILPDQEQDSIVVTGYWSPIAKEYLPGVNIEFSVTTSSGSIEVVKGEIDMTKVEAGGTPHFIARIPRVDLDPNDYTINVHPKDFDDALVTQTFTVDPEIVYFANGGERTDKETEVFEFTSYGSNYTVKNFNHADIAFTRPGYTFAGWNTKADGTGTNYAAGSTISPVTNNIQLYAQWAPNVHNVIWHNQFAGLNESYSSAAAFASVITAGGVAPVGIAGPNFTVPTDIYGHVYHFVGWAVNSADPASAEDIYSPTAEFDMPDHDVHLYALWDEQNKYEVMYHKVADTAELAAEHSPDQIGLLDGTSWTVASGDVFTNPKHKFVGWYDNPSYTGSPIAVGTTKTIASASVNLYAKWQPLYQVTYHDNGLHNHTYVDTNAGIYYESSATAKAIAVAGFTKEDHIFLGWNTNADGSGTPIAPNDTLTLTSDLDLYAIWAPIYGISYDLNGGSGATPANVDNLKVGDSATIAAGSGLHRDGYEFAGWWAQYPDGTGAKYNAGQSYTVDSMHFTVPGEYLIIYAQWNPLVHLYYDLMGGATEITDSKEYKIIAGSGQDYAVATTTDITPTKDNCTFLGWSMDPDNESNLIATNTEINLYADTTLYAIWLEHGTLIYSDNCPLGEPHVGHVHGVTGPGVAEGAEHIPSQTGTTATVTDLEYVFDDFIFTGWNTQADGKGDSYKAGDSITIPPEGVVLHAQWKRLTYTMHYGDDRANDNTWGYNYYAGGFDAEGNGIPAGDGYYHPDNRDMLATEVKHITQEEINAKPGAYYGTSGAGWYFLAWARYEAVSASAIKNTSETAFKKTGSNAYTAYTDDQKNALDDDVTVYREYHEVKTPNTDCGDIDYYAYWVLIAVDVNVHIDINVLDDLHVTGFDGMDKDGFDRDKGHHLVDIDEKFKAELIKNISVSEDFRGNGTEITVTAYVREYQSSAEHLMITDLITASYGAISSSNRIDYDVVVDKIIEYPTITGTTREAIDLKELVSPIEVRFAIPDSWQDGGKVHVFRGHTDPWGNVTAVELTDEDSDPTTYTVSSDEFSTYTLIHIASAPAPAPGDSGTEYLLKYETNGGSAIASEWYEEGSTVSLTKVPTREMHIFTGWFLDAALTQPVTSVVMNAAKTVYAGWQLTSVPSMLNRDDHFAYIVGVGDNKVNPNALITRAEVATMFFRLLKDEIRDGNLTQENTFTDVNPGIWYNAPVSTMQKLGIVDGVGNNLFDPEKPMTRAEFATICVKFDESKNGVVSKFSDIAGHWAEVAIGHAVYLGWVDGKPDGTFAPNDLITRAEAITLVNRVLQRRPETVDDLLPGMVTWVDNIDTNAWYYLNVQEASNSHHNVDKGEGYEKWTEMVKPRDWAGDYEK